MNTAPSASGPWRGETEQEKKQIQERDKMVAEMVARVRQAPQQTPEDRERLMRMSPEERAQQLIEMIERFKAMPDDPPGTWKRFARNIDETRRLEGRPPTFEGEY